MKYHHKKNKYFSGKDSLNPHSIKMILNGKANSLGKKKDNDLNNKYYYNVKYSNFM